MFSFKNAVISTFLVTASLPSLGADDFLATIDRLHQERKINRIEYNELYHSKYGKKQPKESAANGEVSLDELDFSNVESVESYDEVKEMFEYIRDERQFIQKIQFIADGNYPFAGEWYVSSPDDEYSFPRRLSWLSAHTGCETRATLGGRLIEEKYGVKLNKIFIWGDLSTDAGDFSANPEEDIMRWGMHNALIVKARENNEIYILDPATNFYEPTIYEQWLTNINYDGVDENTFTGNICNLETLSESDDCLSTDSSAYQEALERLEGTEDGYSGYLYDEWRSVQVRKNNPYEVLGDNPPWFIKE